MSRNRLSKKGVRTIGICAMTAMTSLAILSPDAMSYVNAATRLANHAEASSVTQGSYPHLSYKGTITMYAGGLTPTVPGINLPPGTPKLTALENIAKQFEKAYPGIKINFVYPASLTTGGLQGFETDAAGGQLPDVVVQQYFIVNQTLPQGMFENLLPYFNAPNPYIQGNKKWSSIMQPGILQQIAAPDGAQYTVDGDWVGTSFYYNKDLFKKAGIKTTPKTWAQLLKDCQILKNHGIEPGADVPWYGWFERLFLGNVLGRKTLQQLEAYTHSEGGVTALGEVIGYHNGILNPATNPKIMSWWPVLKKMYDFWDPTVNDIPPLNQPPGAESGPKLFMAGKVAMVYESSGLPSTMAASGEKPINYGAFPFPSLKNAFPGATSLDSSADVGGPSGNFEFEISAQKADKSMTPEKFQAVLDWLRFFSTPKRDQQIVNELGQTAPTFIGTKPLPSLRGLGYNKDYYSILGYADVTTEARTLLWNLFGEYMSGHITFPAAKQQYNRIVQQAVQQYIATNHVTFSNN